VVRELSAAETSHVGEIAARIAKLARRASAASGRPGNLEISLLVKLSDAMVGSFTASAAAVEISRQINQMVDKFLKE